MEQNEIGFITVAICGGYIGKYPRLHWYVTYNMNFDFCNKIKFPYNDLAEDYRRSNMIIVVIIRYVPVWFNPIR